MRLKDEQVARVAEKIASALAKGGVMTLKAERGSLLAAITAAIKEDMKGEEALEKDAERLLEETLRSVGSSGGIDRHRMLKMIKEKLAKERKIVL